MVGAWECGALVGSRAAAAPAACTDGSAYIATHGRMGLLLPKAMEHAYASYTQLATLSELSFASQCAAPIWCGHVNAHVFVSTPVL